MAPQPEQQARGNIDKLLEAGGWHVCDATAANILAIRSTPVSFRSVVMVFLTLFRSSDDEGAVRSVT